MIRKCRDCPTKLNHLNNGTRCAVCVRKFLDLEAQKIFFGEIRKKTRA